MKILFLKYIIRLFPPEADKRACLPLAGIREYDILTNSSLLVCYFWDWKDFRKLTNILP